MSDPNKLAENHPLRVYWNSYGHMAKWPDDIVSLKWRRDGCYVLVLFKDKAGIMYIADLAAPSPVGPWEMQNDSSDDISLSDWHKTKLVPDCDWYNRPGYSTF